MGILPYKNTITKQKIRRRFKFPKSTIRLTFFNIYEIIAVQEDA
jgi:hypothetical protein